MIPELSNSYLTLPPVDQLYNTPAPQQQYSSSAPLGGVPRVAQTSGSGYRYYDNMQSMPNWMPQAPSHLEPMDSYVRIPHSHDGPTFVLTLLFFVLSSLTHKTGFPRGHRPPIPNPADTTNSSNTSLLSSSLHILAVRINSAVLSDFYSIIIP